MIDEGSLTEPKIELPNSSESRDLPMPRSEGTPGTAPPLPPAAPSRSPPKSSENKPAIGGREIPTRTLSLEPADPRVTHIVLNQLLTGGTDFDKKPGHDGIVVVVEPRNRDEAFVPLAGPITVLVLDPTKTAEQGRIVARWEIDANEAQKSLRNSGKLRGIELRLPWTVKPPEINKLHLYVRYITVDNRDLRADRPLAINLPGDVTQQWTPRAVSRFSPDLPSNPSEPSRPEELTTAPATPGPAAPAQAARPEWRPNR
jgi:hypothetical protein